LKEAMMNEWVQPVCDTDEMDADVTAVIEAFGGNLRTAIKALLIEQHVQEQRIERLAAALSFGYIRGRLGIPPGQLGSSHHETTRT
jgi:hypothetical protein